MEFLRSRVRTVAYIEHPFSFSHKKHSSATVYEHNRFSRAFLFPRFSGPDLCFYAKDFLATIYFALKIHEKFCLCIAADNLNALSALLLRKMRITQKVIFFTIDYTPNRFHNKALNQVYHLLDKVCCYTCDLVWNTSKAMEQARARKGFDLKRCAVQVVVPNGVQLTLAPTQTLSEVNRFDVVFVGHLREGHGVHLLVKTFPQILKEVPEARLIIIGTGPLEKSLKTTVMALGLENYVKFTGYIERHQDVEEILVRCGVAVAPYVPDPNSLSYYSDVYKPKIYMAAGLPVVITKVPEIAWEIERKRAGFAIDYNPTQLPDAIVKLLKDDALYSEYRANAISLAKEYTWDKIFERAFVQTSFHFRPNLRKGDVGAGHSGRQ